MRISDWSSDVCSSDLTDRLTSHTTRRARIRRRPMSSNIGDPGHGHSPAAWAAVPIMLIAIAIGTVAFFLDLAWLVWAPAALVVIGLIVGWALAPAGSGVGGSEFVANEHWACWEREGVVWGKRVVGRVECGGRLSVENNKT